MSSVTVDELVMRIEIELDKFKSEASQAENIDKRLRKSLKDTEKTAKDTGKGFSDLGGELSEVNKELSSKIKTIATLTTRVVGFFAVLAGSNAVQKFASSIAKANDQLNFLSQRLGQTPREIKAIDAAVALLGGQGAGATETLRNLNQGIQEMVIMGNDALIPFFSALGVGVVDAAGNVRDLDDILLDMADSLSSMDPRQAYAIATAMGLDDGMANALIQGRDALEETLGLYEKMYVSSEQQLRASRELSRAEAYLSAQWDGLKTMIANALIPTLTKMTKMVSGWVEFLTRNEKTVVRFFEGLAIAVGIVLLPFLVKAGIALLGLVAPILATLGVVTLLVTAFGLLYDDYKTWAAGGESLFDWGKFADYISGASVSVDSLAAGFARLLTGYDSFSEAGAAFVEWLRDVGVLTEDGFSFKGLGNAFKTLAMDAFNSIKPLQTIAEIIGKLLKGDFMGAAKLALEIPEQVVQMGFGAVSWAVENAASAVDLSLGHDPTQGGTLASGVRSITDFIGGSAATAWSGAKDWAGGALSLSRSSPSVSASGAGPTTNTNTVEVSVGSVNVHTSAATLPEATAAGVAGGIERSADLLNQLGGGLR